MKAVKAFFYTVKPGFPYAIYGKLVYVKFFCHIKLLKLTNKNTSTRVLQSQTKTSLKFQ